MKLLKIKRNKLEMMKTYRKYIKGKKNIAK